MRIRIIMMNMLALLILVSCREQESQQSAVSDVPTETVTESTVLDDLGDLDLDGAKVTFLYMRKYRVNFMPRSWTANL